MPGIIINTITILAQIAMVFGIVFLSCWTIYIVYNKNKSNNTLEGGSNVADKVTRNIIKFAYYLANKMK